jgi:hypothetical protein
MEKKIAARQRREIIRPLIGLEPIQTAINRSSFLVRFDDGILLDGSDTKVISGRDISLIKGKY